VKTRIKSPAFRRAKLKSEEYRNIALICLLGVLAVYATFRALAAGKYPLLIDQLIVFAIVIGYEAFMFALVRRTLNKDGDLPRVIWPISILIETQIPTIAILAIIENEMNTPFQALISPAILVYGLLITLSVLRLSPGLSILTGAFSAIGYIGTILYVNIYYPSAARVFPAGVSYAFAGMIFTAGLIGALVASQTRNYVISALREVELESELKRVKHDLEVARSIQQSLLPTKAPAFEDFEIAGWNLPADETGGDYFDWQEMPDGNLAISLADATGHGIGPALVSTSCRAYARASLVAYGKRDSVLGLLNKLLTEDLPENRFVTYAMVFLDPTNSTIKVLSAGHGPILWYKYSTDEVSTVEANGIPLGMIAGIEYSNGTEGSLESGDVLALVTDGFFEWENPQGEEFGVARMETVLRESRDLPAEEIVIRLRAAVANFCEGTEQKDDLTAVILRRKCGKHSGEIIH